MADAKSEVKANPDFQGIFYYILLYILLFFAKKGYSVVRNNPLVPVLRARHEIRQLFVIWQPWLVLREL